MNSYLEFILYSCRNLKLLQKCNGVLNYAETFYKSNVNCTFFLYKNKSKTQSAAVLFVQGWAGGWLGSVGIKVPAVRFTHTDHLTRFTNKSHNKVSLSQLPCVTHDILKRCQRLPDRQKHDLEARCCCCIKKKKPYLGRVYFLVFYSN